MKNTKRLFAIVLSLVLALAMFTFVACDDPNGEVTTISNVKVWVSELADVTDLTRKQIEAYNKQSERFKIDLKTLAIEGVTESDSATSMITDVEGGADVFCFAQDQIARLVQAGALAEPGTRAKETITANNDSGAVKAATVGDKIYAYPMTSDNGYFLMYDKRVITDESHLEDLAQLVADCEAAGRTFCMETETSAWYLASFFFATGCSSNWTIDDEGVPLSIADNFNSDKGVIALRGMQQLVKSTMYVSSSGADQFSAAIPAGVLVSGTWAYPDVVKALGEENVGCTDLPSFTVDGKDYHMGSYSGNKLMGVKPQKDATRAAALQDLALWLTNEQSQLERFEGFSWGPSNINAQKDPDVLANVALSALAKQNEYGTPQGQIDGSWWDIAKAIGTGAKEADYDDIDALKAVLQTYDDAITAVIERDPSELAKWSVIGGIYGDNWSVDLEMEEKPTGTWTTTVPYYLAEGTQFKVRKGGKWEGDTGNLSEASAAYGETLEDGNAQITVSGLYLIQYSTGTSQITIIPASYGVVGTTNGWGTSEDTALELVAEPAEGVIVAYSATITVEAGAEIKVRCNNSWDYGDFGGAEGANIKLEAAGDYVVTLSLGADYVWVLSVEPAAAE